MKFLLSALCIFLSFALDSRAYNANDAAQTITSDGSYADTAAAAAYVIGKSQDGWVLTVGSAGGTYTWAGSLVMGVTHVFTIQGADPNNRPTIIFNTTANSGIYVGAGSSVVTIKDFIFNVGASRPYANIVGIDGTGVCFRVSNCKFLNTGQLNFGMQVGSINTKNTPGPFGLVDHCQFYFPGGVVYNFIQARANGNANGYGWTQPMSWGTVNSVVVENCSFSQPRSTPLSGLVEADGAARLTLRYNTITNIPESTHGLNSGAHLSTLQIEMYMNNWVLNDTNNTMPYVYLQRGGTAVIWSNTIASTSFWNVSSIFDFWVEAASSAWQSEWFPAQLLYPAGYPATQQVGQGVVGGAQGLVPIYAWGNNTPGTQWGNFALGMNSDGPFIQQGRDIYTNSVMPGYTPLAYPHPLDVFVATTNGTAGGGTGNTSVIPPTNLQAHPPTSP